MQFVSKSGLEISFSFEGLSVAMVDNGLGFPVAYAHRVWVNGECFQGSHRWATRAAAARAALEANRLFESADILFGMTWDRIEAEGDRAVMERAYKEYRRKGTKPAVAIEYARNQVAFSRNGW